MVEDNMLLTKKMLKEIDVSVQRLEKKAKSCNAHSIITDFETVNMFMDKARRMIVEMRSKESENDEILETVANLASVSKRYSDARSEFENKCVCLHKD